MKSSIGAGAIAGVAEGIVSVVIGFIILSYMGLWVEAMVMGFVVSVLILNIFWGAIVGIIYPLFYNAIPAGARVLKGLIYSLIIWLIANVHMGTYDMLGGEIQWEAISIAWGFVVKVAYGLVLGYLYKK